MYPNLYYAFKDLFGISFTPLKIFNSFGCLVALSFLAAAFFIVKELRRKQAQGLFTYTKTTITVGSPASTGELVINFILGFIFGFKILGVFFIKGALNDPQTFIFSGNGSWMTGIMLGLLFMGLKWQEKNKNKLDKPEQRIVRIWPSDRVGDITIIAAVAGFIGAKIFDNLENWDRFIQDPIGNLFSASGFTFYGGLILATIAIIVYIRKYDISVVHMADAMAPALMLSYGLGRIGCQVAGDGDWGIVNTRPNPFGFLPDWAWAYDYPHNVNREGVPLLNCDWGDYCTHLAQPVYPTPLYEIVMSLALFGLLWFLRKRITMAGRLTAIYLFVNGLERFLIEKIRVNTKQNFLGLHPTQAEIISTCLMIAGVVLYIYAPKIKTKLYPVAE
ncbi:prolipoprotein diacylglyceryl transferase [Deminuibacter soli]|uniref:Diacylglyceryl transferase n=1 Tax=Deminuibacter soli TaxID=2291815 RepID=A0A3E1NJJ0_9BACT|nr:prolipoprotein diacylglyceryl transferase family protein [Deminuibacter soli]RFM28105.1 diacylglyceryl transferase [Deminuibacter soli]